MTVRYESGLLHFSLMRTGEISYPTKAKCFKVKHPVPFHLCSLNEMQTVLLAMRLMRFSADKMILSPLA